MPDKLPGTPALRREGGGAMVGRLPDDGYGVACSMLKGLVMNYDQ